MSEYFVNETNCVAPEDSLGSFEVTPAPLVGVIDEDDLVSAHEFLEKLPHIERSALDGLVDRHAVVYEILASPDLPRRNDALYAVVASGFAAAPAHSAEAFDPPAWKRVLGGAARGARMAAHAIAMTTPSKIHRRPVDQNLIDSVLERRHLIERRNMVLSRHAELNEKRKSLLDAIDQDYVAIRSLEEERDERLRDLHAKEAAFVETLMQADLSRPEVHAHADVMCEHFGGLKKTIHNEFQDKYSSQTNAAEKAKLLDIIDSELARLHERGLC